MYSFARCASTSRRCRRHKALRAATAGRRSADESRAQVSRAPIASLEASATPKRADIPNNHFMYALQWFAFATVLVVVYGVFMVRQRREQT